jgi:hypothetical protein
MSPQSSTVIQAMLRSLAQEELELLASAMYDGKCNGVCRSSKAATDKSGCVLRV